MSFLGFKIWRITDDTMPISAPKNSYILVNHWFNFNWFQINNIILLRHHFYGILIKKIAVIDSNGFIWSQGESCNSLPIEHIGPINKSQVIGHVWLVFKQAKTKHNKNTSH